MTSSLTNGFLIGFHVGFAFENQSMTDPRRFYSILKRQQDKLAHAPTIERAFTQAVEKLGPNPGYTELARFLSGNVKPSATAKIGARWTAQTVKDWLYFDGLEPTEQNIHALWEGGRDKNKTQRNKLTRKIGFRVVIAEMWERVAANIAAEKGEEHFLFKQKMLHNHLIEIERTAQKLRDTLRIP